MAQKDKSEQLLITKQVFEKIYLLYWEKVFAVCYNSIHNQEVAKGMVQEIFKSLWERRNDLKLNAIENYLVRSAKYKAFEYIRNKVNREKHLEIKLQQTPVYCNCTEERVLFNNLSEKVSGLVEALPNQCKRVFKMSREEGLTNKEIAALLLITERAVEHHITRALKTLKSNLSHFVS